jgi:hypothetical protein
MITCTDFIAEIGNYLEDDVAQEVRRQLEEHLSHCQTCTVLVDSARKTLKIVTDTGSFYLPDASFRPIVTRIMTRIRETQK